MRVICRAKTSFFLKDGWIKSGLASMWARSLSWYLDMRKK